MDHAPGSEQPGPQGSDRPHVPSLGALELDGNRALVRVDINSPIENGRIAGRGRLRAAARSIQRILEHGAGVVVLAHQGRPGRADFLPLSEHAEILSEELGQDVAFTPHVDDDEVLHAVERVEPGDVLVLDNVRGASSEMEEATPEEHAERKWVRRLAGEVEVYIQDAFPACHRGHASIVGFPLLLPSAAGPLLQAELDALQRATARSEAGNAVLVLGGAKVDDALKVINHHLEAGQADQVLTGGLLGELFLLARGHELGAPTEKVLESQGAKSMLGLAQGLVESHGDAILDPVDLAQDLDGRAELTVEELPCEATLLDIGSKTAERYSDVIQRADAIVMNGPMGAYEREGFDVGTRCVLEAMADAQGFTLIGGGHTVTAMEDAGLGAESFDHVSLAGGALVTYLTGDPLPGLAALEESARRFAIAPGPS